METIPHTFKRRFFIRPAAVLAAVWCLLWLPGLAAAKPERQAADFLAALALTPPQQIASVRLDYDVHMDCALGVTIQMGASLEMKRKGEGWVAAFELAEPAGKNVWSWLILNLIGRHTSEYRDLMKSMATTFLETFQLRGDRFRTDLLEEVAVAAPDGTDQSAIKVVFDYDRDQIHFWEDKTRPESDRAMTLGELVGPLTAFFNYLFYLEPETSMSLINVLRQTEDLPGSEEQGGPRKAHYIFEGEVIRLGLNRSGRHGDYGMALYLRRGNFLDIVYGENIYYRLARQAAGRAKVPYTARIEGIISKKKKRKTIKMLQERYSDGPIPDEEIRAAGDDILAAKNVRAYLIRAALDKNPP